MKKILFFVAVFFALASCYGLSGEKGNGVSVDSELEVEEFASISIPSFVDVYYTQTADGSQRITLTCDENLLEYYSVAVEDEVLVVRVRRGIVVNPKVKTYVTVCSPVLRGVKLSGSGDMFIDGPVVAGGFDFPVSITGSGDFNASGSIQCLSFSSSLSGSGNCLVQGAVLAASPATIKITGSGDCSLGGLVTNSTEIRIGGSGDVDIDGLTSDKVFVSVAGSGDCSLSCKASGDIEVRISGSGDVILSGTARSISNVSNTGSGRFDMKHLILSGN